MMPWNRSETAQVASALRASLSRSDELTARDKKHLTEWLAPVFGTLEAFETFRNNTEKLFTWDAPNADMRDHFELYSAEIITGLVAIAVKREQLPWLPFLAATAIGQSEAEGFYYGRSVWRALAEEVCAVPAEYFERILYESDNEVMSGTMRALCAFYMNGLNADFVREVPIQGKELSDYGYTVEQARRLQDAGVSDEHCRLTFHRKMKRGRRGDTEEATADALLLWEAGVPWLYAHRLFQAGLEPAEVVAAHKADLPIEYAIAVVGSAG